MKHSKGFRSRTRQKLRGGRFNIAESLKKLTNGARVVIRLNPAVHSGMPHPRYQGIQGFVKSQRGRAYEVEINDKNKQKILIAKPDHLVEIKEEKK